MRTIEVLGQSLTVISKHRDSLVHVYNATDGRPPFFLLDRMVLGDVVSFCADCQVWWSDKVRDVTGCWCCNKEGKVVATWVD